MSDLDDVVAGMEKAALVREGDERFASIPAGMRQALALWVDRGEPHPSELGRFMHAVLANDFIEAVCRADTTNLAALKRWGLCLYNDVPGPCWGSAEKLQAWYEKKHPRKGV